MKKTLVVVLLLAGSAAVGASELSVGAQYQTWSLNSIQPYGGSEIWAPVALNIKINDDVTLSGQGEFGNGNYNEGSSTSYNLTALSDLVLGGELRFKGFGLPSILNVAVNVPTGDTSWESKQIQGNIPTEFIDSRYRGRGFGVNAMYGFSLAAGTGEIGVAAGYAYTGVFNPNYGIGGQSLPLKLGDSVFVALNHYQPFSGDQNQFIRLSAFQSLPAQQGGQDIFQMGTNFNLSYGWTNPRAFSFELGAQAWLAARRPDPNSGSLVTESSYSYAPRFYFSPSYAFGDLAVAGRVKYILPNAYSPSDTSFYDGGGFLLGLEPSYLFKLDAESALKLSASYDNVTALNMGTNQDTGERVNLYYNRFVAGVTYLLKF